MAKFYFRNQEYEVDSYGFLLDSGKWNEGFAEGMASELGIKGDLTPAHWKVINFIRTFFEQNGSCPLVFQTCKAVGLRSADFKLLFPSGYQRGACRLAGVTYQNRIINFYGESYSDRVTQARVGETPEEKVYRINVNGFLVDPSEWDENFAALRARELKIGELTAEHWKIIRYLRDTARETDRVPTVFETCEANRIEIEDLERLFPAGYHRGAVKIAGLLVKV